MLREHLAKYRRLMPSMALLFHLIDVAEERNAGPVTLRAAEMAVGWCELLAAHAQRVYGNGDRQPDTGRRAIGGKAIAGRVGNAICAAGCLSKGVGTARYEGTGSGGVSGTDRSPLAAGGVSTSGRSHNGRPSTQYEVNAKVMKRNRQN